MTTTKKNFVQRVIAAIQGSDESKVERFQKIAVKRAEKQIKAYKEENEVLLDRINDAKDSLDAYLEGVPMDKISTGDEARNFSETYINQYMDKKQSIDLLKENIEVNELKIQAYQEFINKLQ